MGPPTRVLRGRRSGARLIASGWCFVPRASSGRRRDVFPNRDSVRHRERLAGSCDGCVNCLSSHQMKPIPLLVSLLLAGSAVCTAENVAPQLPRSTPEAEGIASAGLLTFVEEADAKVNAMHSFMLVRHSSRPCQARRPRLTLPHEHQRNHRRVAQAHPD